MILKSYFEPVLNYKHEKWGMQEIYFPFLHCIKHNGQRYRSPPPPKSILSPKGCHGNMIAFKSDITPQKNLLGGWWFCHHDRDKASALRNISLHEDHTLKAQACWRLRLWHDPKISSPRATMPSSGCNIFNNNIAELSPGEASYI